VRKGRYGADIDEACRALATGIYYIVQNSNRFLNQATEKEGKRCTYLPPINEEAKMMDMRDHILVSDLLIPPFLVVLKCCPVDPKRYRGPGDSGAPNLYLSLLWYSKGDQTGRGSSPRAVSIKFCLFLISVSNATV
jgi:hypothetical protein